MSKKQIKCPICGKMFIPKSSRQAYCDDKHFRKCCICGKEFELRRSKEAVTQVTCSRKCSAKYKKDVGITDAIGEKLSKLYHDRSDEEKAAIEAKRKATSFARYGVSSAFQSEEIKDKIRNTNISKYGVDNPSKSEVIKEKKRQTFQERYGVDSPLQSEEIKETWKATCLERYGTEYAIESKVVKDKVKHTNQSKFGVDYPLQSQEIREKINKVNLEKYGTIHPMQNEDVKSKLRSSIQEKYGYDYILQVPEFRERIREQNLNLYGVEYYSQTDECKERIRNHMQETYGVDSIFQSVEFHKKAAQHRAALVNVAGEHMDSQYEVDVYNFVKAAGSTISEYQYPIEYTYHDNNHVTLIDFKIDNLLFEVKGAHLLQGVFDYAMPVPIEQKLEIYRKNHVILITDDTPYARNLIGKSNSKQSNGLKYLDKCPYPLIGVDINLFRDDIPFPYQPDRPECFYHVKVNGKASMYDAFYDKSTRWKMILNRIMYVGGFIDSKSVITAMNVTRTYKQPSWFNKTLARRIIETYCTSDIIVDPFAGWGTRADASTELGLTYIGVDLNQELVAWHIENHRNISYGDAREFKYEGECSVFICPPYQDVEVYFEGQDTNLTQCEWLQIVMKNVPNAKEYIMVCKIVDSGWEQYEVDSIKNQSHFGTNYEHILVVPNRKV